MAAMKRSARSLLASLLALASTPTLAALEVFSCEPEWAALAEEIGGEHVNTHSATTGLQDVHHIQARPSLIARLRQADLLVCTGAGLEAGWLPVLQQRANNPRVRTGAPGYLELAGHVTLLGHPETIDRAEGDVHPGGNPHIQLDPRNLLSIAKVITDRLISLDPEHAPDYSARHADFSNRWRMALAQWETEAAQLRGIPIVVHHNAWVYLQAWLGFNTVATLEPKPGVPPSGAHLGQLLGQLETRPARLIIHSAYQDPRASQWLSRRTDIPVVLLPSTVGGTEQADDLFGLFEDIVGRLRGAIQ
jgi:zinc/manganese transport system substrate-binding protein